MAQKEEIDGNMNIKEQLKSLKELELIIHSADFQNATFDRQREIIVKKQEEVRKLQFMYNLKEALLNEKNKENEKRTRKVV